MRINTKKYISNKTEKISGFTLIELLTTIMVLALVVGIAIYTVLAVLDGAKEKGYKVTTNNIESVGDEYLSENNLYFIPVDNISGGNEHQCVTVRQLIDMGYFKDEVLESSVNANDNVAYNDYVYLVRNSVNKTLVSSKYINVSENNSLKTLCGDLIEANGSVSFKIEPSGWSKYKNITIYYSVKNLVDSSNVKYQYKYVPGHDNYLNSEGNIKKLENITENGIIYGQIPGIVGPVSKEVSGIDRIKPVVSMGEYSGDKKITGNVSLYLNVTDKESGLNKDTFTSDDIKIIVGDREISVNKNLTYVSESSGIYKYKLDISDIPKDIYGYLKLEILDKSLEDNVTNLNDRVLIDTDIEVVRKYTITYLANGGTGAMDSTVCMYGNSCTLASNSFGRSGFVFTSWNNSAGGTLLNKQTFTYNYSHDITLTAVWKDNQPPTPPKMNFVIGDFSLYDINVHGYVGRPIYAARSYENYGPYGSTDNVGVAKYQISIDGNKWYDYKYADYNENNPDTLYRMDTTGTHKRYFRACDAEGNCSTSTVVSGKVDVTPPKITKVTNPSNGQLTCSAFALTLDGYDEHSGIAYWQYSYSENANNTGSNSCTNWITYGSSAKEKFVTSNFSASRAQWVYLRVCDKAGNCSDKAKTWISIGNYSAGRYYCPAGYTRSGSNCNKTWSGKNASSSCKTQCPGTCNYSGAGDKAEYTCYFEASWKSASCTVSSNKC